MSQMKKSRLQTLRGWILTAVLDAYPKATPRSMVWHVVKDLCDERELDSELAYFQMRRWIITEKIQLAGRQHVLITLTADGYDIAKDIDPDSPLLLEG